MITLRLTKYFNKTKFWRFIWIEQYPERITNFLRYKKSSKADRLVYNFEKKKKKGQVKCLPGERKQECSSACLANVMRKSCESPQMPHVPLHSTSSSSFVWCTTLLLLFRVMTTELKWKIRFGIFDPKSCRIFVCKYDPHSASSLFFIIDSLSTDVWYR